MKIKLVILIILISFFALPGFGQERFRLEIKLVDLQSNDLSLYIDNGIDYNRMAVKDSIVILDDYFKSEYVSIQFSHPRNDGKLPFHQLNLFTNTDNAKITVKLTHNDSSFYEIMYRQSVHLFDEMGAKEIDEFSKEELNQFRTFYKKNSNRLNNNDSLIRLGFDLNKKYAYKQLEAINTLKTSYYSFWIFRNRISSNSDISREEKEATLRNKFMVYQNSYEFDYVAEAIRGSEVHLGEKIPEFKVSDLHTGNLVDLKMIDKPFLIMTWASWCSPCIGKFSDFSELAIQYPGLEFLFITTDKELSDALDIVKKRDIKGHHISALEKDVPLMLKGQLIPKIYLINNDLEVIYNRDLQPDPEWKILKSVLAKELDN